MSITPQGLLTHGGGLNSPASSSSFPDVSATESVGTPQGLTGLPTRKRRLDCLVGSCKFDLFSPTRLSVEELMSVLLEFLTAKNDCSGIKNSVLVGAKAHQKKSSRTAWSFLAASNSADLSLAEAIQTSSVRSSHTRLLREYSLRLSSPTLVRSTLPLGSSVPRVRLCSLTSYLDSGVFVYSGCLLFAVKIKG